MIKKVLLLSLIILALLVTRVETRRLSMHYQGEDKDKENTDADKATTETSSKTEVKTETVTKTEGDNKEEEKKDESTDKKEETPAAEGDKKEKDTEGDKSADTTTPAEGDKPATTETEKAGEGDKPAVEGDKPAAPATEGDKPADPAPAAEGDKPAEPAATEDKPAAEGDKPAEPAAGDKPAAEAGDVPKVPISDLPTMTTAELTLNLSNIKFPDPKPLGDTLNLSSITISKTGPTKCKQGYSLSSDGHTCKLVNLLLMVNLDANNLIIGEYNLDELKKKQEEFKTANPDFVPITCGADAPFLSRQGCIACAQANPYFSLKTFRCSKCPANATYNPEIKNCQQEVKSTITTTEVGTKTPIEVPSETTNQTTTTTTEENKTQTVKEDDQKEEAKNETTTTEVKNENETTTTTATTTTYVSNVEADNFLVGPGQTFDQYKTEISEAQSKNADIKVCPLDKPYSTGTECISCPADKPYFFTEAKVCVNCQPGSTYNSDLHSCVGKKIKFTKIIKSTKKETTKTEQNEQTKAKNDDDE